MRVHFIAIGGAVMHNLALALHAKGYEVSGSDDQIFEPSSSRLAAKGLLPKHFGWFPENINESLDAIILGMHAKADNLELLEAQKLGLKVYSFPEYVFEQTKDKNRVVVAGSHGKTSVTAMIMHILEQNQTDYDYLVGSQLAGFETMVRLSNDAKVAVIEGDEYLTSPLDLRSKFLWYKPQFLVLTGIAWDHINVFPTFESYLETFRKLLQSMLPGAYVCAYQDDEHLDALLQPFENTLKIERYSIPNYQIKDGFTYLQVGNQQYKMEIFGEHNLANLNAAVHICAQVGITPKKSYRAMQTFAGAARRLEFMHRSENLVVIKDFAHAPSKLQASTKAINQQFGKFFRIGCMELHTFSSLNKAFLNSYAHTMTGLDLPIVYYNPKTVAQKQMEAISEEELQSAFLQEGLKVFTDSAELYNFLISQITLKSEEKTPLALALMSSGNFDNLNFNELTKFAIQKY